MSGRKNKWLFEFVEQARSLFWVNKSVSHHKRENFGFDRDIEIVGKERRAEAAKPGVGARGGRDEAQ